MQFLQKDRFTGSYFRVFWRKEFFLQLDSNSNKVFTALTYSSLSPHNTSPVKRTLFSVTYFCLLSVPVKHIRNWVYVYVYVLCWRFYVSLTIPFSSLDNHLVFLSWNKMSVPTFVIVTILLLVVCSSWCYSSQMDVSTTVISSRDLGWWQPPWLKMIVSSAVTVTTVVLSKRSCTCFWEECSLYRDWLNQTDKDSKQLHFGSLC